MREDNAITGADLAVEPESFNSIYAELREMPRIVGTHVRKITIQNFYDIVAESILFFTFVSSILGAIIAFGVVYNTARITLAERSRELASLRVLGFTRGEIAYILLGEQTLLTLVGIPVGFYIGYELCHYLVSQLQTELYRIPLVILPKNYTIAPMPNTPLPSYSASRNWSAPAMPRASCWTRPEPRRAAVRRRSARPILPWMWHVMNWTPRAPHWNIPRQNIALRIMNTCLYARPSTGRFCLSIASAKAWS